MSTRLDLYSLQVFLAVLEEGSIAAAAVREHIAPSALSKRLSELERTLDVTLFQRHARGVEPTSAARALARRARALLHQTQDLASEIRDYSTGLRGRVRVAANLSSIAQFLPAELRRFMDQHPNVQIDLEESVSAGVTRAVLDSAADIGVYTQSDDEQGLDVFPYHRDVMAVVIPRNHPLARRKSVAFAETLDYDHVGMHRGSAANYLFTREAAAINRTLRLRFQVTSYDALVAMVRANLGLGIVPVKALSIHTTEDLRIVPLKDMWAQRQLKLCVRSNEALSGAARRLLDHLIQEAA
ncbi:LysR family transcriptional regulator [Bordetella genomosp. 4]|uniref:LysR family transcriptional regulator n=1 Tax=Bordetella genomosp. 4 TaxID=463044 RepID=A0A261U3N6_9BORD|nr:LysR family transcriptional regulator [Bordetella genomosp. 4]OZI48885.1 LysR family transcriptional regulator [Bordetella genomosp. 4]OZI56576.1 LysR family transcriptional regulator [Bordetella genomosp. 4]